jgi:predicted transglutaminase-like cysteine proteinase
MLAGIVSFTMALAGEAGAKARARKPVADAAPVVESEPIKPPARFFTISTVLAKHDHGDKPASIQMAALGDALVASDASSRAVLQISDRPFGLFTFRAPDGVLWSKWRGVEARMTGESLLLQVCRSDPGSCGMAGRAALAVMDEARDADGMARIGIVNRSVNAAVRYVSDDRQHGLADVWSSPLATLASGEGDCEDYAIAKYMLLRQLGVAETDLMLLLVRDNAVRQDHAVLGVRVDGRWLVLDNRQARVLDADQLAHFTPLFALDHDGVGLFAAPYAAHIPHESETDLQPAADVGLSSGAGLQPLL